MRLTLAVSALILALAAPAQAADKESWDFYKSADMAQVGYGVPESDIITITFRCYFQEEADRDRHQRAAQDAEEGRGAQDHADQRQSHREL